MSDNGQSDKVWAIVSLFGHKTVAGCVTKDSGLFPLLRVDIPATSVSPAYTREFGPGAIYEILYVSEEVARATAERLKDDPVRVYAPELITRQQFEDMQDRFRKQVAELRGLPEGNRPNLRPIDREYDGDDEDEVDDEGHDHDDEEWEEDGDDEVEAIQ